MANKRIKDLTEKSTFASGDYFPIDNDNGTKKVNASKIMTPLSTVQSDVSTAKSWIRSTSTFPTGDAYSSSSSYKVGDLVIYSNTLYRCKNACSAASWSANQSNFEQTTLASAITDVNEALSHVGMIIHSTTLDTEAKVKAIYGGTTWIQHSGYVLRGASSGVVANSNVKTGGNDGAWLMKHKHAITASTKYAPETGGGGYYSLQSSGTANTTTVGDVETNSTTANIPNYKSVYIWERTA